MSMDEYGDPDTERSHAFGQHLQSHRMPPTEAIVLHNYPPQQNTRMPPPWNPTPSPYGHESTEHRPQLPPEGPHQGPYPPPSYPPAQDRPPYGPEYSRQSSISAPNRSPAEPPHPPFQHTANGNPPDGAYYANQPPPDYRPYSHGGPEGQRNGSHPPPLHISTGHDMMTAQQGPPPGHYPPPPHSAGPTPYASYYDPQYNQRRRPVRAAQACDSCRQRKAKCDEGRPECTHCKDNNLKCTYRDIQPPKSEKQVLAISDKLDALARNLEMLTDTHKSYDDKISTMLDMQQLQAKQMEILAGGLPDNEKRTFQAVQLDRSRPPTTSSIRREDSTLGHGYQNPNHSFTSQNEHETTLDEEKLTFSLPPKHTTSVSNLLNWPSIRQLLPTDVKPSYVMDVESERGLLRLYGCGEGEDKGDGHEGASSPATSTSSPGRMDEEGSNSSPNGVWGSGMITAPTSHHHGARDHPGGVSPNGGLLLDTEIIDRFYKSFLDNMHILHPFLDTKVLRAMIQAFKKKYSWDFGLSAPRVGTSIGKRKRDTSASPTPMEEFPSSQGPVRKHVKGLHSPSPIEHSIANAIVLLVIALGKICLHKESLPGAAPTASLRHATPHTGYSDLPMKVSASAPSSPFNQTLPNGTAIAMSSPANPQGKNMDTIPGLAYFAKAADILGELPGGSDVSHIQANLLAGLYMGQLARIFPSHYYITNACKACQILIESSAYKSPGEMKPSRRNLINFAFWSCLQLESDILAEVELPASGISQYEKAMGHEMPANITLGEIPETANHPDILRFYSYQIQLRRSLNDVHKNLYDKEKRLNDKPSTSLIEILNENLDRWRSLLGDWNWDDEDHEAHDVNHARMRGKYYGAKYIIHRPALQYALSLSTSEIPIHHPSESPMNIGQDSSQSSPAMQGSGGPVMHRTKSMGPPHRITETVDKKYLNAAEQCVQAAIRSTTAFDKVPVRLITTNIFGTAHAQFGNLLVLSATYTSSNEQLSQLVHPNILFKLLNRTIDFIGFHENISPILARDTRILQHIKDTFFPKSQFGASSTSSYSGRHGH